MQQQYIDARRLIFIKPSHSPIRHLEGVYRVGASASDRGTVVVEASRHEVRLKALIIRFRLKRNACVWPDRDGHAS